MKLVLRVMFAAIALGAGCTERPVVAEAPTTNAVVSAVLAARAVTQVDLLFAIDDSASMGDKQRLLAKAVPDLLHRLLVPNCIDLAGRVLGPSVGGSCADGDPEFEPVKDIHVAVVTSSLGAAGNVDSCNTALTDRQAHLVTASSAPDGVLAWTAGADADAFAQTFAEIVANVGEHGCGFEAQEESWYRFLVQPDPYASIQLAGKTATLAGVDENVLQQRRAFLRPNSLLAVVQITDENESTADPLAIGGNAWVLESTKAGAAPRATVPCASNPEAPSCSSCGYDMNASLPECSLRDVAPLEDAPDMRFFHMKQRFGLDPQYPPSRYVTGLTSARVPDRAGEHPTPGSTYVGTTDCINPIFAAELPARATDELCHLQQGTRPPSLVFYAAITGVAPDLVPPSGGAVDWRKVLGNDPLAYDFRGADPRMLESIATRGIPGDRDTKGADLQYACTFPIEARTCMKDDASCDCQPGNSGPLCDPEHANVQVRAKAYPGVRHMSLVKSLGEQGILASICPTDTTNDSDDNPNYGYRPAVHSIVDRLKNGLEQTCLPRTLETNESGLAACLVLETLSGPGQRCDELAGLAAPPPDVLTSFVRERAVHGDTLSNVTVCQLTQLPGAAAPCTGKNESPGWCYVHGDVARGGTKNRCTDAILFSPLGNPTPGTNVYLECLEALPALP